MHQDPLLSKEEQLMITRPVGAVALLLLLSAAPVQASTIAATKVSPDGQWKVELADFRQRQVFELFSTPAVGGVRRQIGRIVPALQDIRNDFQFSPDSSKIIYEQGETASGLNHRLWLTSVDRADGRVVSQQPAQSGVGFDYPIRLSCYDSYVEFRSDPVADEQYQTYQINFNGVIQPCVVFVDGFESGNSSRWE